MFDTNNVEQVALTHHDNLANITEHDHDNTVNLHTVVTSGKRKWESVALSNNTNNDMDSSLLSLIHNGPYSNQLSKRHACSQLLAGSVTFNHRKEAVIVNTVEIYGRSLTMDVHRERLVNKKGPSFTKLFVACQHQVS